ncbi:9235_t:CDS:2, partial [Gigaspora rosea]
NDEVTFTLEPVNPTETNNADPDSKSEVTMAAMMKDLNEEQPNIFFQAEPLLTFTWKDQANEIRQLLEEFQDNSKVLKEIKNLFKVSLRKIRAYNLWKGAK